jgi:hypothetical protein
MYFCFSYSYSPGFIICCRACQSAVVKTLQQRDFVFPGLPVGCVNSVSIGSDSIDYDLQGIDTVLSQVKQAQNLD